MQPRSTLSRCFASSVAAKKSAIVNRVRGTRDLLPEDAESHHAVVQTLQQIVQRYGFRQIQTPLLEYTDLFSRSLGDGSDIVTKVRGVCAVLCSRVVREYGSLRGSLSGEQEMYTFADNSGKSVTLRPEGTVGVIRALLSNNLPVTPPQKLFYHGSMYRYERPQRGRYREFQQFGVEFMGSTGGSVDAEVIAMAAHALEALGIHSKASLQINSLGDAESRHRYRVALEAFFSQYKHELSADSVNRLERGSVLRILDSKSDVDQKFVRDAPRLKDFLSKDSLERFDGVLNGLEALGVAYEENARLVRGLDYYSHTVFEFVEEATPETSEDGSSPLRKGGIAVLAGGCYDGLSELLGGPPASCIGWAAGVDRLALLREGIELEVPQTIAVVPVLAGAEGASVLNEALRVAKVLRQSGHTVHFCHGKGNMKKQMKAADRYGSAFAVLVGSDEVQKRQVRIKNLLKREEHDVALDTLATYSFE